MSSDELLNGFYDVNYAYRFGPPKHDIVVATLFDDEHQVVSEAFHFIERCEPPILSTVNVDIKCEQIGDDSYQLTIHSDRFLHNVYFDTPGFVADDNYFHLVPLREKAVHLASISNRVGPLKGYVEALNLSDPVKIIIRSLDGK